MGCGSVVPPGACFVQLLLSAGKTLDDGSEQIRPSPRYTEFMYSDIGAYNQSSDHMIFALHLRRSSPAVVSSFGCPHVRMAYRACAHDRVLGKACIRSAIAIDAVKGTCSRPNIVRRGPPSMAHGHETISIALSERHGIRVRPRPLHPETPLSGTLPVRALVDGDDRARGTCS